MCRFLLIKSEQPQEPKTLLHKFSHMAKNSQALDGDWQGDGWGAAWVDSEQEWQEHRSVQPIWEDEHWFEHIPKVRFLLVHARSASLPLQKRKLHFNQPFCDEKYAYVFNGLLKGVSFPHQVAGEIGTQKIWSLLRKELSNHSAKQAILNIYHQLQKHTQHIQALNIGLCDKKHIYAFSDYAAYPEYYHLQIHASPGMKLICSEELPGYTFYPAPREQVIEL